jgi:hypothetical protein
MKTFNQAFREIERIVEGSKGVFTMLMPTEANEGGFVICMTPNIQVNGEEIAFDVMFKFEPTTTGDGDCWFDLFMMTDPVLGGDFDCRVAAIKESARLFKLMFGGIQFTAN